MRNLAIIQARTGSSRLPNKVLMKLGDKTVLEQVVCRVQQSKFIDEVIVATTEMESDNDIYKLCKQINVEVFRGSENDVLDRFYQCAKKYIPNNIVRITADCPLLDSCVIDKVIGLHIEKDYDFTSNTIEPTFPDGEDVEIMKYGVLKEAWEKAELASQREHVTQYIIHSDKYKKGNVLNKNNLEKMRWTLDTLPDYVFISKLYDELYDQDRNFGMEDILKLLDRKPELTLINCDSKRNEGLKKSLKNDYTIKEV